MMAFDDGATDGEADAHAVAFRRVEGVKQLVHALGVDAHARIPHTHAHTTAVLLFGFDQQLPRAIVYVNHRVRGIAEQVEDDLLELDTISSDDSGDRRRGRTEERRGSSEDHSATAQ